MGVIDKIKQYTVKPCQRFVRQRVSPRLTGLYGRLGFVNRQTLADNLRTIGGGDSFRLFEAMVNQGVIKYRFRDQVKQLGEVQPFMLSGRVDRTRLQALVPELNTSFEAELQANADYVNTEIMGRLLQGVTRATDPVFTRIVNRGSRIAFYTAAAAAAATGFALCGISFGSVLGLSLGYSLVAKILARWTSPHTALGRTFQAGSAPFYPVLFLTAALGSWGLYNYISDRFYPRYEHELYKEITISADGAAVEATVCSKATRLCTERELIKFETADGAARARQTAGSLQEVVDNNELYWNPWIIDDENNVIIVPDRWFPAWIPYTSTTILNVTPEVRSGKTAKELFSSFVNNLWASGVMPSQAELRQIELQALRAQMNWRYNRDPKLKGLLDLASLTMAEKNYDEAFAIAQRIIDHNLTVTSGAPVFYNEAVFLQSDIRRIQAMLSWDPKFISQTITLLREHSERLRGLEDGYRARYNQELLRTCATAQLFFPEEEWEQQAACTLEKARAYADNATFGYNRYTPTFNDNFLGIQAYLEMGRYLLATKKLDDARTEANKALALAALIGDCSAVTAGETSEDTDRNWQLYSPYFNGPDRFLGERFNRETALYSFAERCTVARTLRGDWSFLPLVSPVSSQFDAALFKLPRAQAYQLLGRIEMRAAELDQAQAHTHLTAALGELRTAKGIAESIMYDDILAFNASRYEERTAYFEILTDYASVLLDLYNFGGAYRNNATIDEIFDLAELVNDRLASEPLDYNYLRSLLLLAEVDLKHGQPADARAKYQKIVNIVSEVEGKLPEGASTPPHYRILKEQASLRLTVIDASGH